MDAAEKSLFIKFIDSITTTEDPIENNVEIESYISDPQHYIEKLRKRASDISQSVEFQVGDIVKWKDGLKNKRYPGYGQPCIVLKKIFPPIIDQDVSDYEELNVRLAFITEDDDFFSFNYDGNRFRHYNL